jgi:hypothetical protein
MKATVELVYDDATKNRKVDVTLRSGLKGLRLMNAIEKAVEKTCADDKEWQRWNLVTVEDFSCCGGSDEVPQEHTQDCVRRVAERESR